MYSKIINMYIVATQFNNAISDPKSVFPFDHEFAKKIYPYIVNKAFACEVYLKILILSNDNEIPQNHRIKTLYKLSGIEQDFKNYIQSIDGVNDEFINHIDNYIESFSNAFVEWRYIYERDSTEKLMYGFMRVFAEYLSNKCKNVILNKYKYDFNQITTFL